MDEVETSQVIDTMDMIGMGMGEQDRVDMRDIFPERLFSQVCGGVHQNVPSGGFNDDRSAGAFVTRIAGRTDRAAATYHRHTGGGAAAKDGYFHECLSG